MTINYHLAVSTSRPWTLFKLLIGWRGSLWKSVIVELSVWLCLYALISIIYRHALSAGQKESFALLVKLNFMLGFFVTTIVQRWTYLYQNIGFIDNVGLMAAEYIRGRDEQARLYRRSILRYCELGQVLVFRDISMRTRRRFPTLDTLVAAGFMMEHEKVEFDAIQYRYSKHWLPFQWALALAYDARQKGLVTSDYFHVAVAEEIKRFRTNLQWLCNYDWTPLPIAYPQLVCLAVHLYFLVCLLARQYIVHDGAFNKTEIDLYFPIMTCSQFIFYVGWLKVAEAMLNPFGEDDDDFECNALIDRNICMGLMIVDQGYDKPPALKRDPFWEEKNVQPLYSEAAAREHTSVLMEGSAQSVRLSPETQAIVMVSHPSSQPVLSSSPADLLESGQLRHRRVSIVPVKREDTERESRTSTNSLHLVRTLRSRLERSFSRASILEPSVLPRSTLSTSHLDHMSNGGGGGGGLAPTPRPEFTLLDNPQIGRSPMPARPTALQLNDRTMKEEEIAGNQDQIADAILTCPAAIILSSPSPSDAVVSPSPPPPPPPPPPTPASSTAPTVTPSSQSSSAQSTAPLPPPPTRQGSSAAVFQHHVLDDVPEDEETGGNDEQAASKRRSSGSGGEAEPSAAAVVGPSQPKESTADEKPPSFSIGSLEEDP